jgi:hypothetical protein
MTVKALHKELSKLIDQGYSRKKVLINKNTFKHPLELDGCCILDVKNVELQTYNILNDDGGFGHGENDQEKYQTNVVLSGEK